MKTNLETKKKEIDHKIARGKSVALFSPAKLNLFLKVKRKREDGYHDIFSLFQALSFGDHIAISLADADAFSSNVDFLKWDEHNLIVKAIQLFRRETGIDHPLQIHLDKKIPPGAGLGGGSSNAATTLMALQQLFCFPLPYQAFADKSASLGSDVPFFFSSGRALCRGRGEEVSDFSYPQEIHLTLALLPFSVSTPDVYRRVAVEELPMLSEEKLISSFEKEVFFFHNDLEIPAFMLEPRLKKIKEKLETHFSSVCMSGSGSTFFCLHEKALIPTLEGVSFISAKGILRQENSWYSDETVKTLR